MPRSVNSIAQLEEATGLKIKRNKPGTVLAHKVIRLSDEKDYGDFQTKGEAGLFIEGYSRGLLDAMQDELKRRKEDDK